MELVEAYKFLGAGIAALGVLGAGIGLGILFGNFYQGAMRNPAAAAQQQTNLFIGMALAESTALFALVIALLILFS